MRGTRRWLWPSLVLLAAAGAAVGVVRLAGVADVQPTTSRTPAAAATRSTVVPTPRPESPHPVSLPALIQKGYDGHGFRIGRVLVRVGSYTRYSIRYRSGDLRISGIMNVPAGDGPFPVLILNHGYHDVDVYTSGRGLMREQEYLARRGYVVVHPDYRNHAQSDDDPNSDFELRLGYTEDVINAAIALRKAKLPFVDPERLGMLGRSMGGGVSLNAAVVRPDLFDAVVLYAPVSSDTVDNFNRWIRRGGERRVLARRIEEAYGSPRENPDFWRHVSPRTFLDRVAAPIQIHHGTEDGSVPIAWTEETVAALEAAGKGVTYHVYKGEAHAFGPQWSRSMRRTVAFFEEHLSSE